MTSNRSAAFFHVHQVYSAVNPDYTGRATVPVLWDRKTRTIVNKTNRRRSSHAESGSSTILAMPHSISTGDAPYYDRGDQCGGL